MFKKLLFTFIISVIFIISGFFYYQNEIKEEKINHIMDQVSLTLAKELKTHKMDDLKIALLLAKNEKLIDTLENDDEDLGYQILSDIMQTIKKETQLHVRAQIITKELNILARSWDDVYAGMPLGNYRTDFDYFKTHNTPRTSIEIGRRVGIKATVPIYKDGEFIGFVEVISFFKSITEYFRSMGVDLYVLLNIKDSDSAVLMVENLSIGDSIVANRNYNYGHIQTLKSLNYKLLKQNKVLYADEKYIFYETMYDGDLKPIGAFLFVLPQKYLDYFRDPEDDISFLINVTRSGLYDVEKENRYDKNQYDKYLATSMVYLQDIIDKEDRELFLDEAYEKFDQYSKDELIQMMLNRKIVKKIDGKIR